MIFFVYTRHTVIISLGRLQALYIRLGSKGIPISEETFHIDKFLRDLQKNTWNFVQQQRFTMYTFVVVHKTNAIPVLTVLTIPYWLKSFVCFVLFFCQSPNNLWLWKISSLATARALAILRVARIKFFRIITISLMRVS